MNTEEHRVPPPVNWSREVVYATTAVWNEETIGVKEHYEISQNLEQIVEYTWNEEKSDWSLTARCALLATTWLGQYGGYVVQLNPQRISALDKRYLVFYAKRGGKMYFVDAKEAGNELRFLRRSMYHEEVNALFRKIHIDGTLRVFVEITRDIEEGSEIVVQDEDNSTFQYLEHGPIEYEKAIESSWTVYSDDLLFDKLTSEEEKQFNNVNLANTVIISYIDKKGHPCYGQRGLFAVHKLLKGMFLGEYTGLVELDVEKVLKSKYLVDYSQPELGEFLERVWVDAQDYGNETRFINDSAGTGGQNNVVFKRTWIMGKLLVLAQATQDIEAGEEILTDYGEGYWDNLQSD